MYMYGHLATGETHKVPGIRYMSNLYERTLRETLYEQLPLYTG